MDMNVSKLREMVKDMGSRSWDCKVGHKWATGQQQQQQVNEPGDLNPYYSGSPKFESRLTLLQERAPNMRTTMIMTRCLCLSCEQFHLSWLRVWRWDSQMWLGRLWISLFLPLRGLGSYTRFQCIFSMCVNSSQGLDEVFLVLSLAQACIICLYSCFVQLLSRSWLFVTPWTAVRQPSLSLTISRSLPKLKFIESVMPSNHLILCHPLLLLPLMFRSIRVFSNESALHIRWPPF